jgi:hypothetical protein
MATHPLIGVGRSTDGMEAYVLGTGLSVSDLVKIVELRKGVASAAELLGMDEELVQAAVDFAGDPQAKAGGGERAGEKEEDRGWLQIVTQVVGLFAAVATVVYIAGSVVLSLRLAFEHLPWDPVVGQLPREFVLSTGAGQVLLPSLIVGALYALFRVLRRDRGSAPSLHRWRDGSEFRRRVLLRYLLVAALLLVPGAIVLGVRQLVPGGRDPDFAWLIAGYLVMLLPAVAFHEVRAILSMHYPGGRWNKVGIAALVAGVYAAAAVPAMIAAAAGLPFNDARVCTTTDFEEDGVLVGQSGDRIYLGEKRTDHRRLAVFPLSQVEELFIGDEADQAACDFGDARLAVVAAARADAARAAAKSSKQAARLAARSGSGQALVAAATTVADRANEAGLATLDVGDAGSDAGAPAVPGSRKAGHQALAAVERLRHLIGELDQGSANPPAGQMKEIVKQVDRVTKAARRAAEQSQTTADAVLATAKRRQPTGG